MNVKDLKVGDVFRYEYRYDEEVSREFVTMILKKNEREMIFFDFIELGGPSNFEESAWDFLIEEEKENVTVKEVYHNQKHPKEKLQKTNPELFL